MHIHETSINIETSSNYFTLLIDSSGKNIKTSTKLIIVSIDVLLTVTASSVIFNYHIR